MELQLVEEDERTLGPCQTGEEWDLMWMDDLLQGKKLVKRSIQNGGRLTVDEHRSIGEAVQRLAEVNPGFLSGGSVQDARSNAEAKRNASCAAAQANAYGLATRMPTDGTSPGDDPEVPFYPSRRSFYQTLAAQLKDVL
ncbi:MULTISPECIES: hypothetical protein [Burkholderia]|uniref:hypothetical protein n=1 Tax=Burkholderia TaxID=32008 RepID=UPI0012E35150|nr:MULTISPECIES: hypothetical protein [Burkholderia]